jgi:RHS repeat-associated protein
VLEPEAGESLLERSFGQSGQQVGESVLVFIGDRLLAQLSQDRVRQVFSNHIGYADLVTDSAGSPLWYVQADAFGETDMLLAGSEYQDPLRRYPGQWAMSHPDVPITASRFSNGHRWYDAQLGRYFQADPIGLGGDVNLFAYSGNNPMRFTDPLGIEDQTSPWETGWEWLTGTGPREHFFTDGDPFTELLRQHPHIRKLKALVCSGDLPAAGRYPYYLGGAAGVPKYLRDYSTLATGGLTGNLAVTYLGSYNLTYVVSGKILYIYVENSSNINSATHPPWIGYTQWWNEYIGEPLNEVFDEGALSETRQYFFFRESLCDCKG